MKRLREILVFENAQLTGLVGDAVEAIDAAHQFPDLEIVPIAQSRSHLQEGAFIFQNRPNRLPRIEISKHAEFPALTLIHEVGHLLDALVLNPLRTGFGTELEPAFEPFLIQIGRTPGVRRIQRLASARHIRASARERAACREFLFPYELWARAYCQRIVTGAASLTLKDQFMKMRATGVLFAGHRFAHLWDDGEFNDIIPLVDDLLKRAGLT